MDETNQFGIVDFIVFFGMFGIASGIGIFYAYKDRKKEDTENYYFGGSELNPVALGLSIAVTFISAITIIGFPTHTYLYGLVVLWYPIASCISKIIACLYYIPLVHRLKLVSIYEYLEIRFNSTVRSIASTLGILNYIFYMATTMYLPALALSAVTPLELNMTISLTGLVCTFYTTLGGMKAVVWTDAFQALIMFAGQLIAFLMGLYLIGGFGNLYEGVQRGMRDNMFDFTFDMTKHYTFWSTCVALSLTFTNTSCINQSIIQRYLSCKSVRDARIACISAMLPTLVIMSISIMTGGVMYVYYEGCDPLESNAIDKPDQLLPYMVVEIFKNVPGVAGLFVSAAFSGTLSTVSSGINSLSVLIMEDCIRKFKPNLTQKKQVHFSKIIVVILGVITTGFAFTISMIESTIIEIGFAILGAVSGPVLGVYTLGIFFPWCTSLGVIVGQGITTIFLSWVSISALMSEDIPHAELTVIPPSIDNCTWDDNGWNMTTQYITTPSSTTIQYGTLESTLFAISYLYYGTIALIMVVIIGLLTSFITGANKPEEMRPELFIPFIDNKHLPASVRNFFRFGVPPLPENQQQTHNNDDVIEVKSNSMSSADDVFIDEKTALKDTQV